MPPRFVVAVDVKAEAGEMLTNVAMSGWEYVCSFVNNTNITFDLAQYYSWNSNSSNVTNHISQEARVYVLKTLHLPLESSHNSTHFTDTVFFTLSPSLFAKLCFIASIAVFVMREWYIARTVHRIVLKYGFHTS